MKQTKDCPKCKDKAGWWVNMKLDYDQYYNADGSQSHAVDGDGSKGKRLFCYNCNWNITHCITP